MIHLTAWRKGLGREFDFGVAIMARCGAETGPLHSSGWASDVNCDACLTGPFLGDDQPPTHGAREKAWFR